MATHQDNNQPNLALPGYPATTESLPSDTVLQHLLESDKINSLHTTEIPTTSISDPHQLVYNGYQTLAECQATLERQAANESLTLHPGLTNELRALQMEAGFETTSDFLHHLVVTERVKRLQLQQKMLSSRHNYARCPCSSAESTVPNLMDVTSCSTYATTTSTVSLTSSNHDQGVCMTNMPSETVQLCSFNLGGTSQPTEQPKANHGCQKEGDFQSRVKSESVSVGVQVNLCHCGPQCETRRGKPRKHKEVVMSKVKKKRSRLQREVQDGCDLKGGFGKISEQNAKRKTRWSGRVPHQPKQRFARDTKSAPREKQEYLCEICGATFKWRRSLIPHMWEHREEVSIHQCPHCSISFPYACRLKRHLIAKHPELEGGPIRCATCGVEVQSFNTLRSHMRIHTGYKPFKCKFCPKAYKWNTGLEYHERVHTGERPFPCQRCTKAFTNKSDLTRHQTVHTGEKPHVCQKCGKGFTQSHTLKSHCKKHHPASLSTADNIQKPCQSQVNTISQAMQSPDAATFMLGSFQHAASANHSLEQMKFTNSGPLQSLQRQVPTEREIAEVVVNMLAQ